MNLQGAEGVATAVQLMLDGTRKVARRKGMKITTSTYGLKLDNCYFVCPAGAAFMEMIGMKEPNAVVNNEVSYFEEVINLFRVGATESLFHYCDCLEIYSSDYDELWRIRGHNWRSEFKKVEKWLDEFMTKHDLEWVYE